MELFIKNMVCDRCIRAVNEVLQSTGLVAEEVELGRAEVRGVPEPEVLQEVENKLKDLGFELIRDKKNGLVEQIKGLIISYVDGEMKDRPRLNLSDFLAEHLASDYKTLNQTFSSAENLTIGQYHAFIKIEKVKELIDYDELSLSQISDTFNYSSPSHLTKQFRRVTGITPKEYKTSRQKRSALDKF